MWVTGPARRSRHSVTFSSWPAPQPRPIVSSSGMKRSVPLVQPCQRSAVAAVTLRVFPSRARLLSWTPGRLGPAATTVVSAPRAAQRSSRVTDSPSSSSVTSRAAGWTRTLSTRCSCSSEDGMGGSVSIAGGWLVRQPDPQAWSRPRRQAEHAARPWARAGGRCPGTSSGAWPSSGPRRSALRSRAIPRGRRCRSPTRGVGGGRPGPRDRGLAQRQRPAAGEPEGSVTSPRKLHLPPPA